MLRQVLILVLLSCLLGMARGMVMGLPTAEPPKEQVGVCESPVPSEPTIQWITQEQARQQFDAKSVIFVDARPQDVFQAGHVAGALSAPIDHGTVENAMLALLKQGTMVIAYCDTDQSCARSSRLAALLSTSGLHDVRVLEGGMPAWLSHGYPAEAGVCRHCP